MEVFSPEVFLFLWLFCCSYGLYLTWTHLWRRLGDYTWCSSVRLYSRAGTVAAESPIITGRQYSGSLIDNSGNTPGGSKAKFLLQLFTEEETVSDSYCPRNAYIPDDIHAETISAPSSEDIPERFLKTTVVGPMEELRPFYGPRERGKMAPDVRTHGGDRVVPARFQLHSSQATGKAVSGAKLSGVEEIEHWLADCLQFEHHRHAARRAELTQKPPSGHSSLLTCAGSHSPQFHRCLSLPMLGGGGGGAAGLIASRRISNSETCLQAKSPVSLPHTKLKDPLLGSHVDEFLSENIVTSQMDKLKVILSDCCDAVESHDISDVSDPELPLGTRLSLETVKVTQLDLLDGLKQLRQMVELRERQTLSVEEKRSRLKALKTVIGAQGSFESVAGEGNSEMGNPLRRTFSQCGCGCDQLVQLVEDLKRTFIESQVTVQQDIIALTKQLELLAENNNALKTS